MIKLVAVLVAVLIAFICGVGFLSAIPFSPVDEPAFASCAVASTNSSTLDLTQTQLKHAATIHRVAEDRGLPRRASVIAIATALQESTLHNYGHRGDANDHDSLGLFQQRPSQGWGTTKQLTNPRYAAGKFFDKLTTVEDWESLPLTQAAQAVQRSAFPDAYAKWERLAKRIVDTIAGSCSGWTQPVKAGIVSGYRAPDRRDHYGVDLGATRGTTIVAVSAGTVTQAECQAWQGDDWYGCATDGSPAVSGCGWHVTIAHPGDILTVYCHLNARPIVHVGQKVSLGQHLGTVGSTGNSSGPHLHFEVHDSTSWQPSTAVNPVSFMERKGAPLK